MLNKGKMYNIVENITPPFILRSIKKSNLYPHIVGYVNKHSSKVHEEEVEITGGDIEGFKLKINPNGRWQPEMITGEYDHELFTYLHTENLSGKVIYDIGAHICYHSMVFAKYAGKKGHVFAFEPNLVNIARAQEILALNPIVKDQITLIEKALSNTTGDEIFLSTDDLDGGSSTGGFITTASTLWDRNIYIDKSGFKESTIQMDTIDNMVTSQAILPPDILKIDVEGAEQLVLDGARKILSEYKPQIIIEFHSIYSTFACMTILSEYKYNFTILKQEPDGRVMIVAK